MLLHVSNIARKDTLDHICTVQTIHAVSSHHTFLGAQYSACLRVDLPSLAKTDIKLCHEMTIRHHLFFNNSHELAKVLPLHFFALAMKIEPYILDIWVIHVCNKLREFISNLKLTAFLIDQIYKVLLLVDCICLINVFGSNTERSIKVRIHFDWW